MVLRRPRSLIGLSMSKHGGGRLWLSDARESGAPASSGAPAAAWASAQRRIIACIAGAHVERPRLPSRQPLQMPPRTCCARADSVAYTLL
jgi:hypothetical protein